MMWISSLVDILNTKLGHAKEVIESTSINKNIMIQRIDEEERSKNKNNDGFKSQLPLLDRFMGTKLSSYSYSEPEVSMLVDWFSE